MDSPSRRFRHNLARSIPSPRPHPQWSVTPLLWRSHSSPVTLLAYTDSTVAVGSSFSGEKNFPTKKPDVRQVTEQIVDSFTAELNEDRFCFLFHGRVRVSLCLSGPTQYRNLPIKISSASFTSLLQLGYALFCTTRPSQPLSHQSLLHSSPFNGGESVSSLSVSLACHRPPAVHPWRPLFVFVHLQTSQFASLLF